MRFLRLLPVFAVTLPLPAAGQETPPEKILLNDFRPVSIFKIPITEVSKAKYPVIDLHTHPYAETRAQLATWVELLSPA